MENISLCTDYFFAPGKLKKEQNMRKAYRWTNESVKTEEVLFSTNEGDIDLSVKVASTEGSSETEIILSRQSAIKLYHQLNNLLFTH